MPGIPRPTQPTEEVNQTWLRTMQAIALLSAAAVAWSALRWAVGLATRVPGLHPVSGIVTFVGVVAYSLFFLPPLAAYLGILWCTRRKNLKLGLAIGVSTGLIMTAVTTLMLLFAAGIAAGNPDRAYETTPAPFAPLLVLFILMQFLLAASAALTYYSTDRQPDDRRILLKGFLISLAGLWGGEILCGGLYVLLLGVLAYSTL
jgi:hypothetical protein